MEIHPPHGPIRSWRDFVLTLVTITTGVCIALSLEGLLEWNHHRRLAREAREMIGREMADNKKDLDGVLADADNRMRNIDTALRFSNELLSAKKTDIQKIDLGLALADLSTASWQSAESTGALAQMPYAEVQKYARVYGVQDLYAEHQRRTLERLSGALALFAGGNPHQAAPKDLEAFRQQVLALRASLHIEDELGKRLSELYRTALER